MQHSVFVVVYIYILYTHVYIYIYYYIHILETLGGITCNDDFLFVQLGKLRHSECLSRGALDHGGPVLAIAIPLPPACPGVRWSPGRFR